MYQKFDLFNQVERPQIYLCNPNKQPLFSLDACYNTQVDLRFNGMGEFSFVIPEKIQGETLEAYAYVEVKRLVYIENIAYFIISEAVESSEGVVNIKTVKCYSLEAELINKRISTLEYVRTLADGTTVASTQYPLRDNSATDLLDVLFGSTTSYVPNWSVEYVSPSLISSLVYPRERSFEVNDINVYEFLMNDVATAFDCIFTFDTINRTVSVYDKASATTNTDIYLSYDNLVKHSSFTEKSDEIVTCLSVHGAGDMDIITVNPLGGNKVYNFDYYKNTDWMSQGLIAAINAWEAKIETNRNQYAALLLELKNRYTTYNDAVSAYNTAKARLQELEAEYKALLDYEPPRSAATLLQKRNQVVAAENDVDNAIKSIVDAENSITAVRVQLQAIVDSLRIDNITNFTVQQMLELHPFIIENTYQNSNFVQTDSMTNLEIQAMSQQLYDQVCGTTDGVPPSGTNNGVLARVSQPRYEFEIDSVNFLFLKEFQEYINQLELGCLVTIDIGSNVNITSVLLEISFSYENPESFSLTFSNRLRLDNGKYIFSDLFSDSVKAGTSVKFNSMDWSVFSRQYKNSVSEFLTGALNAAANEVISADNQEITINKGGIRCRKSILDNGDGTYDYDNKQLWITSQQIAFTDDNWVSAKAALGRHRLEDGSNNYTYGLVAETIVGKLLAGNALSIQTSETSDGSGFYVGWNGVTIQNADFSIVVPNKNKITMNASTGIAIQRYDTYTGLWEDKLFLDSSGNAIFKGQIQAYEGLIGGWSITENGIVDSANGNYIRSNGQIKLGQLTIDGNTAVFNGTIYAANLGDLVTNEKIQSLSADKIAAGTITASIKMISPSFEWQPNNISGFSKMEIKQISDNNFTSSVTQLTTIGKIRMQSTPDEVYTSERSSYIEIFNRDNYTGNTNGYITLKADKINLNGTISSAITLSNGLTIKPGRLTLDTATLYLTNSRAGGQFRMMKTDNVVPFLTVEDGGYGFVTDSVFNVGGVYTDITSINKRGLAGHPSVLHVTSDSKLTCLGESNFSGTMNVTGTLNLGLSSTVNWDAPANFMNTTALYGSVKTSDYDSGADVFGMNGSINVYDGSTVHTLRINRGLITGYS